MSAPMCRFGPSVGGAVMHFPVKFRPINSQTRILCKQIKQFCTQSNAGTDGTSTDVKKPDAFWDMMEARTEQASRTLLVKVPHCVSVDGMLKYLRSQVGSIANHFPYSQKDRYALVEFHKESSLKKILKKRKKVHFLSLSTSTPIKEQQQDPSDWPVLNQDVKESHLVHQLSTDASSVSDQLEMFYRVQRLQEPEVRLRFLLCLLLEDSFQTLLPDCNIYPFGSSVNGFGRRNCDVDMYLDRATPRGIVPIIKSRNGNFSYDLRYDKQAAKSDRVGTQLTLRSLSQYLRQSIPYCKDVFPILQANCPLVKFNHSATGLSCDLSADNRLGLTSSQLLYVYGHLDPRVRHMVFIIRHWARNNNITSAKTGPWITNFPLTVLVIYFLQTRAPPVVPSLDYLRSIADISDKAVVDGVDTTFIGDFSKVPPSQNSQSSESLLQEFFHFCATFDFEHKVLSIRRGEAYMKPANTKSSLYIENPFETHRNASQNVSDRIVELLRDSAKQSLVIMNASDFAIPKEPSGDGVTPSWGAALLVQSSDEDNMTKMNRSIANIMNILEKGDVSGDDAMQNELKDNDEKVKGDDDDANSGTQGVEQVSSTTHGEATDIDDTNHETTSPSMFTSLLYMYGQKHNVKVEFTFTEEKAPSNTRVFKAQCHIGDDSTTGTGKTKKMAKHEAARSMMLNLSSTATV